MANKKKKNIAKKLLKEKFEKERASRNKEPDPQSHEFYYDEIDSLHQEKYKVEDDSHDLEEKQEEELLPFSESEEEDEESDQGEAKNDDDDDEEEKELEDDDSLLDEDSEAITKKLLDDDEGSDQDIEKGLPSRDAWGDDKSVYFSTDEKWIFKKKFDSQDEFEASKRRMQETIEDWKEISNYYDEAAVGLQIRPTIGIKKKSLPQLPAPKSSSLEKSYTVDDILNLVKGQLDLRKKNFEENLKTVINNLPKDGKTPSSFEIYPALKKMMDDYKANDKRKLKDGSKMVLKKKRKKEVRFDLLDDKEDNVSDSVTKEIEEEGMNEEQTEDPPSRPLTYEMMKNKGLTPYRKKEYRNPRVRNKNKYRKALIKRRSKVAAPFEQIPVYEGEKFGINVNVIRSRKFNY